MIIVQLCTKVVQKPQWGRWDLSKLLGIEGTWDSLSYFMVLVQSTLPVTDPQILIYFYFFNIIIFHTNDSYSILNLSFPRIRVGFPQSPYPPYHIFVGLPSPINRWVNALKTQLATLPKLFLLSFFLITEVLKLTTAFVSLINKLPSDPVVSFIISLFSFHNTADINNCSNYISQHKNTTDSSKHKSTTYRSLLIGMEMTVIKKTLPFTYLFLNSVITISPFQLFPRLFL